MSAAPDTLQRKETRRNDETPSGGGLPAEPLRGGTGLTARASSIRIELELSELAQQLANVVVAALEERVINTSTPWFDLKAAATHLSCSPERLRKLVQAREIPFHQERPGGRVFFHRDELNEWLLAK